MAVQSQDDVLNTDEYHTFELATDYDKTVSQMRNTLSDEKCRLSNMSRLLAEHDKDILYHRLETMTANLRNTELSRSNAEAQLRHTRAELSHIQSGVNMGSREFRSLKAEAGASQVLSTNNAKLMAENATLSREISTLKTEMTRLRSEFASHQSIISEKLALERQVSSLEIELQTERRRRGKARLEDSPPINDGIHDNERLETLRVNFLKEKSKREKATEDAREKAQQCIALQNQVDDLSTTLRTLKEQFKGAQNEQRQRNLGSTHEARQAGNQLPFKPGMTIATPGGQKSLAKSKRISANPGDKSSFSVTPFLNRTSLDADALDTTSDDLEDTMPAEQNAIQKPPHVVYTSVNEESMFSTTMDPSILPVASNEVEKDSGYSADRVDGNNAGSAAQLTAVKDTLKVGKQQNTLKRQRHLGRKREITLFDADEDIGDPKSGRRSGVVKPHVIGAGRPSKAVPFSPLKRRRAL